MTYRELLSKLQELNDNALEDAVVIALKDDAGAQIIEVDTLAVENEWVHGPALIVNDAEL